MNLDEFLSTSVFVGGVGRLEVNVKLSVLRDENVEGRTGIALPILKLDNGRKRGIICTPLPIYRPHSLNRRWLEAENSAASVLEKRKFCSLCREPNTGRCSNYTTELLRAVLPVELHRVTGRSCMLLCAHVVSADTPGISRPARVRFVKRDNRRCDKAPSISCHVPSKRRNTECPSLRPDQTVVPCDCHCRQQQVCSCNTEIGSASETANFRAFVRAAFTGILFKGLVFHATQSQTLFKRLFCLNYATHTDTLRRTHNTYSYVGECCYNLPHLTRCPERPSPNDGSYLYQHTFSPLRPWSLYVPPCLALKKFRVLPTQLYLWVLYGSQNKQRLFHYTALSNWFLQPRGSVFTARYGLDIQTHFRVNSVFTG